MEQLAQKQPKSPETFKAFLAFLLSHIWLELCRFFARISVKGNIMIDIPEQKRLPPKRSLSHPRKVVRMTDEKKNP